jgi:hypothetical protein
MPKKIPTVKLNLNVGHGGMYYEKQKRGSGKAAVAFFNWRMKGDTAANQQFLNMATSLLTTEGWKIESKGRDLTNSRSKYTMCLVTLILLYMALKVPL